MCQGLKGYLATEIPELKVDHALLSAFAGYPQPKQKVPISFEEAELLERKCVPMSDLEKKSEFNSSDWVKRGGQLLCWPVFLHEKKD